MRRLTKPSRHGLSTLEMVLVLPLLLLFMAALINWGTFASWKVRSLNMARHSLWASRWPRSENGNPQPDFWPQTASRGTAAADNAVPLDDPRVDQPVARGPLPAAVVNRDLLDPTRGPRSASADLSRDFPLLPTLGPYQVHAGTQFLDDLWQYPRTGLAGNLQRRIPVIYALTKASQGLSNAYVRAAMAIMNAPFRPQLAPLDRDDEFLMYSQRFGWGSGAPDFHPRLHGFCSLERSVAQERVDQLIDRIQGRDDPHQAGVPENMANAFIGLYRRVMNETPPPTPQEMAALQAKIDILMRFLESLRN